MVTTLLTTLASLAVVAIFSAPIAIGKANPSAFKAIRHHYYFFGNILFVFVILVTGSYDLGYRMAVAKSGGSVAVEPLFGIAPGYVTLGWICFLGYIAGLSVYGHYAIDPQLAAREAEKKTGSE